MLIKNISPWGKLNSLLLIAVLGGCASSGGSDSPRKSSADAPSSPQVFPQVFIEGRLRLSTSSSNSSVIALSKDGKVAGGYASDHDNHGISKAAIWRDKNGRSPATDLGTLKSTNSGFSKVYALSEDGTVAAGMATSEKVFPHATIWSNKSKQKEWKKTDLTPLIGRGRRSAVFALSANGKVAGGICDNIMNQTYFAAIWKRVKGKWEQYVLNPNTRSSAVFALSANGIIAGGTADTYNGNTRNTHAAIWRYTNQAWSSAIDLGTLNGNNSGKSAVTALSADGTIAGGAADTDNGNAHAAIWTSSNGTDWSSATDLGALDDTGNSEVKALSADGTIAGGWSESGGGKVRHATLWRLKYYSDGTASGNSGAANDSDTWNSSTTNGSEANGSEANGSEANGSEANGSEANGSDTANNSGTPVVVAKIGVRKTLASVAKLANDRFATIEQQRLGLGRLENGCIPAHVGKSCYLLGGGASGFDRATDVYSAASFGHVFSDSLASGVTVANTFSGLSNLPGDLKRDGISPGVGVWARWRAVTRDGYWYLRGAIAANRAKIKRSRYGFANIEPGTGTSTSTGWNIATELGRGHDLNGSIHIGYYGGLRHSDVQLSGYTEKRAPGFHSHGQMRPRAAPPPIPARVIVSPLVQRSTGRSWLNSNAI